jgi:hypothetical protein
VGKIKRCSKELKQRLGKANVDYGEAKDGFYL